jgi:glutamine---fructose-6-phosphate transaminase (isomerizing)
MSTPLKTTPENLVNSDSNQPTKSDHFMLREIFEQPDVVRSCLSAYLQNQEWGFKPGSNLQPNTSPAFKLNLPDELYANLQQVHILACGTSFHAGLVGQYLLEQVAGVPTRVISAAEFPYAPLPLVGNTLTIGVTQSGETADTLAALDAAHQRLSSLQNWFLAVTNQPQGSIAQRVQYTIPTPAGKEVGVAATKTFIAQLMAFYSLALNIALHRQSIAPSRLQQLLTALQQLPEQVDRLLNDLNPPIAVLAQELVATKSLIFWGSGINYPIALEGALKLKETTYIHAEGYAAGEFMHGPIAMLDPEIPVVAIVPSGQGRDRILSNARKAKSYGTRLFGITSSPSSELAEFDDLLVVPAIDELLSPILNVIPIQLLAYHTAVARGINVDKPRHITKALTV